MPHPSKKPLSPGSRVKADRRNARGKTKRAATAAASGGAKSAKRRRGEADLAEEEMPVSGGGSSSNTQICFDLHLESQTEELDPLGITELFIKEAGAGRRGGEVLREVTGAGCVMCM
jgi:hypothetical protein